MPHLWDQIHTDLCLRTVGSQPDVTGGLKNVSSVRDGGGLDDHEVLRCTGCYGVFPLGTRNRNSEGVQPFTEYNPRFRIEVFGIGLPKIGIECPGRLCGDRTMLKTRIPLSEWVIYVRGTMVDGSESFCESIHRFCGSAIRGRHLGMAHGRNYRG